MEKDKEIRMSVEELEAVLRKAGIITAKEAVNDAHIEPGELIINVVR